MMIISQSFEIFDVVTIAKDFSMAYNLCSQSLFVSSPQRFSTTKWVSIEEFHEPNPIQCVYVLLP